MTPAGNQTPHSTTKPFPIRLTAAERQDLERQAGSQPLGTYIKSVVFAERSSSKRSARRPVKDQANLAQLLGMFGQSTIAARLDSLSKAVENGALVVDEDTIDAIQSACAEVHAMHALLMHALGFQVKERERLPSAFNGVVRKPEGSPS